MSEKSERARLSFTKVDHGPGDPRSSTTETFRCLPASAGEPRGLTEACPRLWVNCD